MIQVPKQNGPHNIVTARKSVKVLRQTSVDQLFPTVSLSLSHSLAVSLSLPRLSNILPISGKLLLHLPFVFSPLGSLPAPTQIDSDCSQSQNTSISNGLAKESSNDCI